MSVCVYSCRPERRVGAAVAVSALFFCGAMAFSAVGLNNQIRRVFNLTALFMLVVCFLVVKRFLATAYSYAVYAGEEYELVIYEHTLADKEPSVVCRVALTDVVGVRAVCKNKKVRGKGKSKKAPRERGRWNYYNYAVSIFEGEYIEVTYADGDDIGEMRLSYDEGLLRTLTRGRG